MKLLFRESAWLYSLVWWITMVSIGKAAGVYRTGWCDGFFTLGDIH
jgi:hypothetical protein